MEFEKYHADPEAAGDFSEKALAASLDLEKIIKRFHISEPKDKAAHVK